MNVLITGADGRLASHVRPLLRSEGFNTISWGREIRLHDASSVSAAVMRLNYPIDALVHLAGAYELGNSTATQRRMIDANYWSFVNVFQALEYYRLFTDYPTLVAIGHSFDVEADNAEAYYYSKELLHSYMYMLNGRKQYATIIHPIGAIDTPTKRDDVAFRILDAIVAPIHGEELANDLPTEVSC